MGVGEMMKKGRCSLELYLLSKGKGIDSVCIPEIPIKRQRFANTTDEWVKLDLPKDINASGCIYYGKKDNSFPPHKHNNQTEQVTIINPGGKMTVITNAKKFVLEYPNSVFFDIDEPHSVFFNEDTVFSIIWHPAFKLGWEAEFEKQD